MASSVVPVLRDALTEMDESDLDNHAKTADWAEGSQSNSSGTERDRTGFEELNQQPNRPEKRDQSEPGQRGDQGGEARRSIRWKCCVSSSGWRRLETVSGR